MKISMVMIAKDEVKNVAPCFDSFWDDVDEVVLVDTGSTDGTIAEARKYAKKRRETDKLVLGHFDWCDDFAAARNYADSLATGDWRSWGDLDDEVVGMPHLRQQAEDAGSDVVMLYVRYDYAVDAHGNCFCELWRERLVRASANPEWIGRVHECQVGHGTFIRVDPEKARWVHRRPAAVARDRNELILRKWFEEEPNDPRVASYLPFELLGSRLEREIDGTLVTEPDVKKIEESIGYFHNYLALPNQPPEMRAQNTRRLAMGLQGLGRFNEAEAVTLPMIAECPSWPDSFLTLAEVAHERGDWPKTIEFAKLVLDKGAPETLLIINPQDYTLRPKMLLADSLAQLGRYEDACALANEIVGMDPHFLGAAAHLSNWASALAREQAAALWVRGAQLLFSNDELEKAVGFLGTAPYFVAEHPAIISMRVTIAAALREPYQLQPLTDSPRAQFLARCLREQAQEMLNRPTDDVGSEENPVLVEAA